MAHPYGTEAMLQNTIGTTREGAVIALAGATAASVLTQHREDADAEIDAALCQAYEVPFTGGATQPVVARLSNLLTAANLLEVNRATSKLAELFRKRAETMLARILDGTYEIPGATKATATTGRLTIDFSAQEPIASGRSDGVTDMNTETDEGTRSEW